MGDIAVVADLAIESGGILPDAEDAITTAVVEAVAGDLGDGEDALNSPPG
jgi:hypothetical protein